MSIGLFLGMVACLEVGFRLGRRSSVASPELAHEGVGTIEAAVFGAPPDQASTDAKHWEFLIPALTMAR